MLHYQASCIILHVYGDGGPVCTLCRPHADESPARKACLGCNFRDSEEILPLQAFLGWIRRHARVLTTGSSNGDPGRSLPEQVEALHAGSEATPERSPQFWLAVLRLAALGWTEEAVGLLGLHSAWHLAYAGAKNQHMLSVVSQSLGTIGTCVDLIHPAA